MGNTISSALGNFTRPIDEQNTGKPEVSSTDSSRRLNSYDQNPIGHQISDVTRPRENRTNNKSIICSFEKPTNQKGIVLIINYLFPGRKDKRNGSCEDVSKLKNFFEKRSYKTNVQEGDMSTNELRKYLEQERDILMGSSGKMYHSFICIVMSHGNETSVETKDGTITRGEIVNYFRNDVFAKFIGKPKIFLFQSCRGTNIQRKFGNDSSRSTIQHDSSNVSTRLPKDADIMIICATTHGHFAYRGDDGSWLIKAFLEVATKHPENDIENIMTGVRHELATNKEYEDSDGECQMAVSENTLTKLFFL